MSWTQEDEKKKRRRESGLRQNTKRKQLLMRKIKKVCDPLLNVSTTDHLRSKAACFRCGVRETQKQRARETTLERTRKWVGEMQKGQLETVVKMPPYPAPIQDMFWGAGKPLYLSLLGGALL